VTSPKFVIVKHSSFQAFAVFCMLYAFFWVIPRRLEFIRRRFGTLCLFHLHRQVDLPTYEDGTECSDTSAYKLQTPGNYPKEGVQHSETCLGQFSYTLS